MNPQQREAVETLDGPVLVIAGAGSGKTRTLVHRVARLVARGTEPEAILLLTFTRKAASAMLERAARLVGPACARVAGGTFHAFAHRMLRVHAPLAGYPVSFTILDRADTAGLLRQLAGELGLGGSGSRFPKKATVAAIFSRAANTGGDVTAVLERDWPHLLAEAEGLRRLYEAYTAYKRAHGLMDYDDLLLRWCDVLEAHPEVREAMGRRFRYLMVDEYQDTNAVQARILRLVACGHDNVMAVGDDAQSIYAFRGANFRNILDFPKLFPGTRIVKLERNYRTTQPNLDCTNAIIAHAREKFTKHLVADRPGGRRPVCFTALDELDQARFVADRVASYHARGVALAEMAVLFRAGFHSFQLEAELNTRGIPFTKRGGLRLVEAAHIKDVLGVLRLLVNPYDRVAWNRVLQLLPGVGPKGADRVFAAVVGAPDPFALLEEWPGRARWTPQVRRLGAYLRRLQGADLALPAVLERIEAWYRPYLERRFLEDHPRRSQDLAQLRGMAGRYEDAVTLLAEVALDPPEPDESAGEGDRLVLSTIHSAKGLEWRVVFVIHLAEGRFPAPSAEGRPEDLEEERRLFYVATTRARDDLYLCRPAMLNFSGAGLLPARPSRFLEEIPADLLEQVAPASPRAGVAVPAAAPREAAPPPGTGAFPPGARVRHTIFGPGRVLEVLGPEKLRVHFDVSGEKVLNLQYARLQRLGG
ncbi:ATP-dependent helicase [Dissulfurirhabdus thermomarina]|uniref:ATP-dependent helicase n=1 Tax=Dissulfurirhabdus thermomarina TaxID=1765737 RepID=UPI001FE77F1E|nr:ATP-dependent helicase [Dissulfurirhabdus thermomarina]